LRRRPLSLPCAPADRSRGVHPCKACNSDAGPRRRPPRCEVGLVNPIHWVVVAVEIREVDACEYHPLEATASTGEHELEVFHGPPCLRFDPAGSSAPSSSGVGGHLPRDKLPPTDRCSMAERRHGPRRALYHQKLDHGCPRNARDVPSSGRHVSRCGQRTAMHSDDRKPRYGRFCCEGDHAHPAASGAMGRCRPPDRGAGRNGHRLGRSSGLNDCSINKSENAPAEASCGPEQGRKRTWET